MIVQKLHANGQPRPRSKLDQFPELRELTKHGANILEKPFLPSELLRKVEDTLNQGEAATGTEG